MLRASMHDLKKALPFDFIIIDEVHERNQATDLLMAILVQAYTVPGVAIDQLPNLVVMSATLDLPSFRGVRQLHLTFASPLKPLILP